jgi:Subtilase family
LPRSADPARTTTAARLGGPLAGCCEPSRWRGIPPATAGAARAWALALCAGLLVLCTASTPSAHAEEVFTSQAAAAHATDSTWIPAPANRAAVCIVDTGNDPNPDTTNVIARFSVDGEPGTDRSPDHHGTLMSMIASAPYNGFGMVGAAPSINVVSVRASRDGVSFGGGDLRVALQICITKRIVYNIKVVSLSLGGTIVSGLDQALMSNTQAMVDNAQRAGLSVVAAAGNHGGDVDWPAGYLPVFAVGASDASGERCGWAAHGPEVDLWAPGCPVDAALSDGSAVWANGSSESTAFVAGALTQLRGLRSDLGPASAERALIDAAAPSFAGPSLNVEGALRASQLGPAVDIGHSRIPESTVEPTDPGSAPVEPALTSVMVVATAAADTAPLPVSNDTVVVGLVPKPETSPPTGGRPQRLAMPRLRSWAVRDHQITARFFRRPPRTEAHVVLFLRMRKEALPTVVRRVRLMGDTLRVRISGILSEMSVTFRDPSGARSKSSALVVRLKT